MSTTTRTATRSGTRAASSSRARSRPPSEVAVADKHRTMGYIPLEVRPANAGMQREITFGRKKKIKLKDSSPGSAGSSRP